MGFYKGVLVNRLSNHLIFRKTPVYSELKKRPLGFVDIGARGGIHPLVQPLAEVTGVLGFEPDKVECQRLREVSTQRSPWAMCEFEPVALAEKTGNSVLHLLAAETNHSLRQPNNEFIDRYNMVKFQKTGCANVDTTTLDEVLFSRRVHEPNWGEFLKIDTQGTEYEILTGAKRTLTERTSAILVEVEFCQIYRGQKLFSEIELFLRELGFSFYGFSDMSFRSCKQLNKQREKGLERPLWADAVFFKETFSQENSDPSCECRRQYVLFVTAILLGYFDFALEVARKTWAKDSEGHLVQELIKDLAAIPEGKSADLVKALSYEVEASPSRANVLVGKFIDEHRFNGDYGDVILY